MIAHPIRRGDTASDIGRQRENEALVFRRDNEGLTVFICSDVSAVTLLCRLVSLSLLLNLLIVFLFLFRNFVGQLILKAFVLLIFLRKKLSVGNQLVEQ